MKYLLTTITLITLFFAYPQASDKHVGPGPSNTQSLLWLVGDSSLHAYSSTAQNLKVEFEPGAPILMQLKSGQLKLLKVTVPVNDMRSGRGGLDKNMQKALKAGEHPNIVFQMEKYEVLPSTGPLMVKATGVLEVAGVKKPVALDARLTLDESGARLEGTKELLMTDYGIKPPKVLMIKTTNEVKVNFDLKLDPAGQLK